MRSCTCPVGTYLTTPPSQTSPQSVGQIQKLIFQLATATGGYGSSSTSLLEATWTAKKAAVDEEKIIVTPFVSAPTVEIGKAKEFGSGNEVRNGIPIIFGTDPTKFTFKLYEYSDEVIRALKELACESVKVGFVNELGQIIATPMTTDSLPEDDIDSNTLYFGWEVQAFHISDRMLGGFDAPDHFELAFQLKPGWSDYLTIVTPTDFSGLDL